MTHRLICSDGGQQVVDVWTAQTEIVKWVADRLSNGRRRNELTYAPASNSVVATSKDVVNCSRVGIVVVVVIVSPLSSSP